MDTSKEYIKMCEKAEELNYSPSGTDGNWYYYSEENMIRCRNSYEGDFGDVWLPRQDQLQEMMSYDLANKCVEFYCFISGRIPKTNEIINDGQLHKFKSMEQLWLAFVMAEKFGKQWSGSDWVKK